MGACGAVWHPLLFKQTVSYGTFVLHKHILLLYLFAILHQKGKEKFLGLQRNGRSFCYYYCANCGNSLYGTKSFKADERGRLLRCKTMLYASGLIRLEDRD